MAIARRMSSGGAETRISAPSGIRITAGRPRAQTVRRWASRNAVGASSSTGPTSTSAVTGTPICGPQIQLSMGA